MSSGANSHFDLQHLVIIVFVPASMVTNMYSSPLFPIVLTGPYASQNSFVPNCTYFVLLVFANGCFFIVIRHPLHCLFAEL